ncbi:MAG: carboxyl transferase domain-containing protein, partial [Planctomycetota bacterium]|nr:carboxyl transferase domain-containing protein [Planctomycetota bacterium]
MAAFKTQIQATSASFGDHRKGMLALVDQLRALEKKAEQASAKNKARFEKRGQFLPRERVRRLLDPGSPFLELGNITGFLLDHKNPEKSLPGASLLTGIGFVSGTRCMVVASDSGINAGAMTHGTLSKVFRAFDIAHDQRLPFIHLVESAGANLRDYKVEFFVQGGEVFARHAMLSAAGIPVITVLHGSSTAGGAYMPGMSDLVIAVKGRAAAFLAGPPLLRAATGEIATAEELGGANMHATVSGLVEYLAENDAHALRVARDAVKKLHWGDRWLESGNPDFKEPLRSPDELAGVVPLDYRQGYDVREVVYRLVDASDFLDFKPDYGPATVCLEAKIHGHPIAIIGNNGPIDNAGATKATHFIQHCCQIGTPILFLQNTTGYRVGTATEQGGMIKHGSKMIQAVTCATVPTLTIQIGASFGAGNYGMCGRGYRPNFLFLWPNAKTGVMGAEQAATTMRIVAEMGAKRKGMTIPKEVLDAQAKQLAALFQSQESALYTSGRGLDD